MAKTRSDTDRYLDNWRDEIDSAAVYRAMADGEDSPELPGVYRRLAEAEERHATSGRTSSPQPASPCRTAGPAGAPA